MAQPTTTKAAASLGKPGTPREQYFARRDAFAIKRSCLHMAIGTTGPLRKHPDYRINREWPEKE